MGIKHRFIFLNKTFLAENKLRKIFGNYYIIRNHELLMEFIAKKKSYLNQTIYVFKYSIVELKKVCKTL